MEEIESLGEHLSPGAYSERIKLFINTYGRKPKVPDYMSLLNEWDLYKKAQGDPTILPWFIVCCGILKIGNSVIPIAVVRDEEAHDKIEIITTILLEEVSSDVFDLFTLGLTEKDFNDVGYNIVPYGYANPTIRVSDAQTRLSRYYRYHDKIQEINIIKNKDSIKKKLNEYKTLAKEYWKSQNVSAAVTDDIDMLMGEFTGGGFNDFVAFEVLQSDTSGIALFSHIKNKRELYWDLTRRGVGNNIGNNILLTAVQYAQDNSIMNLNMGMGRYRWKWQWCDFVQFVPSIRPIETKFIYDKYQKVKHLYHLNKGNKERLI